MEEVTAAEFPQATAVVLRYTSRLATPADDAMLHSFGALLTVREMLEDRCGELPETQLARKPKWREL